MKEKVGTYKEAKITKQIDIDTQRSQHSRCIKLFDVFIKEIY